MTAPLSVVALRLTPVKGLRLSERDELALDRDGARDNRRFYLIDARGRMVNGKQIGALQAVVADYDGAGGQLTLTFPGGRRVSGAAELGEPVQTSFFSCPRPARQVVGPWSRALSAHAGQPLRLVEAASSAVDRGPAGAVSLVSWASIERLATRAGGRRIDPRRFRMLIEIDGVAAHEEDSWIGREVQVGSARLRFVGHVGRCLVTERDPRTGEQDLPTLELLAGYRRGADTTEPLAFGVFGEVLEPGRVRVGDRVQPA